MFGKESFCSICYICQKDLEFYFIFLLFVFWRDYFFLKSGNIFYLHFGRKIKDGEKEALKEKEKICI